MLGESVFTGDPGFLVTRLPSRLAVSVSFPDCKQLLLQAFRGHVVLPASQRYQMVASSGHGPRSLYPEHFPDLHCALPWLRDYLDVFVCTQWAYTNSQFFDHENFLITANATMLSYVCVMQQVVLAALTLLSLHSRSPHFYLSVKHYASIPEAPVLRVHVHQVATGHSCINLDIKNREESSSATSTWPSRFSTA